MFLRRVFLLAGLWLSTAMVNAAPLNDRFTNATELIGFPVSAVGNNVDATFDTGGPSTGLGGRSIWWRWTAPFTGRVVVILDGNYQSLWCTVWKGSTLTNLSLVGANQLYYGLFLSVTQGVTYHIAVDNGEAGAPAGDVRFRIDAIPANDNFADAAEVTGSTWQVSADNRYATEEGEFFLSGWLIGTLWWKWTAPFSGEARLSIGGSEGEVYAWMGTGSLTNLQVLQGTMPGLPRGPVEAGVTYWICAATAHGRGRIKLTLFPPNPPNDRYAARLALTNLPVRLFASTLGAANEPHEPKVSGSPQSASVWWTWVAPASGRLLVKATQVSQPWWFSLDVSVFTGRDLRHLKLLATHAQEVSLPVKAGQEYTIAVSGATQADFFLEARLQPPPANDAFEHRQPLAGARRTVVGDNTGATRQSGEPRLAPNASGASLWYSWTAPADGWCTMSVTSSNSVAAGLIVFTGRSLKSLKRLVPAESVPTPALPPRDAVPYGVWPDDTNPA